MIDRNRAWRRRKTRLITTRIRDTKDWLMDQIFNREETHKAKADKAALKAGKRHKAGKLTHAQDLRQKWSLNSEQFDALYREPIVEMTPQA